MLDMIAMWMQGHPLQFLAGMVTAAVAAGVVAVRPGISELLNRHHPRC